ncbi:MAG TPA: hypothetical protein VD837_06850 [Terriglobales bacterium]|nr:hypothetical protein [Terriglobales bacterium]
MNETTRVLLQECRLEPVLMEVGATDRPPELWNSLAPFSTYIGIGSAPGMTDAPSFKNCKLFKQVVVSDAHAGDLTFYETQDPVYSGVLRPDAAGLSDYYELSRDLNVTHTHTTAGTSISTLVELESISYVDWFKTNVNGVDRRVYESLPVTIRNRVLAVDTVVDLVPLCEDQDDTFLSHPQLISEGFWLSSLTPCGSVRLRASSCEDLKRRGLSRVVDCLTYRQRRSPLWAFVRYFRTLAYLAEGEFSERDYEVLWCFAFADGQYGFCLDIALEYERRFGKCETSAIMLQGATQESMKVDNNPAIVRLAKRVLPPRLKRAIKELIRKD